MRLGGRRGIAVAALVAAAGAGILLARAEKEFRYPSRAALFETCEIDWRLPAEASALARFPETQIHDAYDADRDGVYVRLEGIFERDGGESVAVPGFAMREEPGGPWAWRIRWSPRREGRWRVRIRFEGRAPGGDLLRRERALPEPIEARADPSIEGPLAAPGPGENPGYLRRLRPDGTSEALWLFGACRAWVSNRQDPGNDWSPWEWIDRETELLAPMREAGMNLLNQWMAPWEFSLVHHDRAEFWRGPGGDWRRQPLPPGGEWSPFACLDQGRARAFDDLVRQCEGGPGRPPVRLLLSPIPHQMLQEKAHPWGGQESGWSPQDDAGKQTPERLDGFSGFWPRMRVWDFFEADPAAPLADGRSRLFDHQANFFRYVVARWGASRGIGVWVLVDELDAIGDEVGSIAGRKGWWAHPACDRWLADVVRLFRGTLARSDGMRYAGDPFAHPLHAATTSHGGQFRPGANLEWGGGAPAARADLVGWHWYPFWDGGWSVAWPYTIDGIGRFARAAPQDRPRLVSEFGAPDRARPDEAPSPLYPTLYHHAIWAAIFSGLAGTPMDWDDGKEFGELKGRDRKGIFDRASYPIDLTQQVRALRTFLGDLDPEGLAPCGAPGARIACVAEGGARAFALHSIRPPDAVFGWVYAPGEARLSLSGLAPGSYRVAWHDPWTGAPSGNPEPAAAGADGRLILDAGPVLRRLRSGREPFPEKTRLARGDDVAFKVTRAEP